MAMIYRFKHATEKQCNYIEILFNDLQFTYTQRNAWLSHELKRPINRLGEILAAEGSFIIARLKKMKEDQRS